MTCKEIETVLPALLEGALSGLEKKTVEEHLHACESCSKALRDLKKSDELVKCLEEVEPPPWLKTRVMARVREEAGQKEGLFRKLFYPLYIKVPIQAFAMVLIAVVAWNIYRTGEPEFRQIAPPAVVEEVPKAVAPAEPAPAEKPTVREKEADRKIAASQKETSASPVTSGRDQERVQAASVGERKAVGVAVSEPARIAGTPAAPAKDADIARGDIAMERQEKNEAARGMAWEPRQKAMKAPAGALAKDAGKQEAASAAPPAVSSMAPPKTEPDMILRVRDPEAAVVEIGTEIKRLGGRLVERQNLDNRVVLSARIGEDHLRALREKIRSLGEVRKDIPAAPYPDADGNIAIRIEIRQN